MREQAKRHGRRSVPAPDQQTLTQDFCGGKQLRLLQIATTAILLAPTATCQALGFEFVASASLQKFDSMPSPNARPV